MEEGSISDAIEQICRERGIDKDSVIETIEAALAAAYKKDFGNPKQLIKVKFDLEKGATKIYRVKEIVADEEEENSEEDDKKEGSAKKKGKKKVDDKEKDGAPAPGLPAGREAGEEEEQRGVRIPEREITISDAIKESGKKKLKVGDTIEKRLETPAGYGRIAAQTAKQVIIQRIREAERDIIFSEYKKQEGNLINGVVQRIERDQVLIDLGKATGVIFKEGQMATEHYAPGQRIRVILEKIEESSKGPQIVVSRTHPDIIKQLFELEIPELTSGAVELKSIAREAGIRSKVAVHSEEEGVDPIGSCVGQRGARVQAIINELGGEKLDIVLWDKDPKVFIENALSPAKIVEVKIKKKEKEATVFVPGDQLSLAIGKAGQNVRLASRLTGYKLDVEEAKEEKLAPAKAGDKKQKVKDEKDEKSKGDKKENEKPKNKEKKDGAKKKGKKKTDKDPSTPSAKQKSLGMTDKKDKKRAKVKKTKAKVKTKVKKEKKDKK